MDWFIILYCVDPDCVDDKSADGERCCDCGLQVFAAHYHASNPDVMEQFVNGADTVLLLAFATVLLNTDLHNDCIRPESKMTIDQFVHNLRGEKQVQ